MGSCGGEGGDRLTPGVMAPHSPTRTGHRTRPAVPEPGTEPPAQHPPCANPPHTHLHEVEAGQECHAVLGGAGFLLGGDHGPGQAQGSHRAVPPPCGDTSVTTWQGMGSPGHRWSPLQSLTLEGDEHPRATTRPCRDTPRHSRSPPGHTTAPAHQRDTAGAGGASAPGGAQPSQGL